MLEQKPKLTIGIPVYNGEKNIKTRLDNILSQTFQNFQIIISDNKSTDKTSKICQEFTSKDKRIQYIQQDENIGGIENYQFVLNKAQTKYFVWAADDDFWDKTFLEKNISILEKDNLCVGSIGKIQWSDTHSHRNDEFNLETQENIFKKYYKQIRKKFQHHGPDSIIGNTFEKRASVYLRKLQTQNPSFNMYSIFRTNALQKSINPKKNIEEFKVGFWNNVCIAILEYGNIHLIDEKLIYYSTDGGGSGITPITQYKKKELSLIQCVIPWHTQTIWFIHKFGLKFFFKYFGDFFGLFIMGEILFLHSLYNELKKYIHS